MQIALMSTSKGWGGGEQLLAYLISGLVEADQAVGLVARRDSPMAAWGRDARLPAVLELPGRGRRPSSLRQLRQWLQEQAVDALVLNDPHAITSGGVAAWRLPIARVGIRHTVFGVTAWKHRLLLDHIVCVSQAAQQACLDVGLPAAMTSIIHCGLPAPQVDPNAVQTIRQMFTDAGDPSAAHLLGLGSLIPVKGFADTIRALAQARRQGRNWHLWIAGDGADRAKLEALARKLKVADRTHLLGFRSDVGALLQAADAFVSASYSEGLPLVLVEAMQAGCPIACTPVGGCVEAVDAAGANPLAEIFAPGNIAGAVRAIDRCLDPTSAREARVAAARRRGLEHFALPRMAAEHLALYQRLGDARAAHVSPFPGRLAA